MATAVRIAGRQAKDGDGITSKLADQMHASKGAYYMAIVELKVDEVADLRELTKHLWDARQEQPTLLDGEPRQSETDIIDAGKALVETPA